MLSEMEKKEKHNADSQQYLSLKDLLSVVHVKQSFHKMPQNEFVSLILSNENNTCSHGQDCFKVEYTSESVFLLLKQRL